MTLNFTCLVTVVFKLSILLAPIVQIPSLVRDSRGNSMNGNPRSLSDEELADLLVAHL